VHRHVLRPDGEVEGDDRDHGGEPGRRRNRIEQSPAVRAGEQRGADRRRRQEQPQERRVDDDQAQIGEPAGLPRRARHAPWRSLLPAQHDQQDTQEAAQPQRALMGEHEIDHGSGHRRQRMSPIILSIRRWADCPGLYKQRCGN
jgi:hypothetical protein